MSNGLDCMLGRRCDSVTLHTCDAVPEVPSISGTLNISPDIQGEDDGTSLVPVERYLAVRQGEKPLGVYALYDSRRNLQYVGYARNMTMAIKVPLAMQGILQGNFCPNVQTQFMSIQCMSGFCALAHASHDMTNCTRPRLLWPCVDRPPERCMLVLASLRHPDEAPLLANCQSCNYSSWQSRQGEADKKKHTPSSSTLP